jgi:predicted enzyme related to lactoylglutathione lyase
VEVLELNCNFITQKTNMKRVTGIGGLFFKCEDPEKIKQWYKEHPDLPVDEWGASFGWRDKDTPENISYTAWSPFPADTGYFDPSRKDFIFNYPADNLEELLRVLAREGVEIIGEIETYEYGKFGWIMDPEGNKIELRESLDDKLLP